MGSWSWGLRNFPTSTKFGRSVLGRDKCRGWEKRFTSREHFLAPCPPPPPDPVGPNFSHHKARVQAVGWFPLGSRKQGGRPFAPPTPPPQMKWGHTESRPGTSPPPSKPSHPHCRPTHGDRGPSPCRKRGGRRTASMLGTRTRMVTQQVVVLSQTPGHHEPMNGQVDPSTTLPPPPPACTPNGRGARSRRLQGLKSGGCEGLTD